MVWIMLFDIECESSREEAKGSRTCDFFDVFVYLDKFNFKKRSLPPLIW